MSLTPSPIVVKKVVKETAEAISIHFETPNGFSYHSGQYITIIANINGQVVRRAYSLCSSPFSDLDAAVSLKRVQGGVMSNWLIDNIKAGQQIMHLPPMGNFFFTPDRKLTRHIVLVGAGSGITPLYSILKTTLDQEPYSKVTLIYGNRTEDSIIFKAGLEQLQKDYPAQLQVIHCLTCPPEKWYGACGRINQEILEEVLYHSAPSYNIDSTEYYMCGPMAMMDSVQSALLAKKVPSSHIHRESFFSNVSEEDKQAAIEEAGVITRTVKIIYDGDVHEFDVQPDQTILEAALDLDIDLPYSCQSGLCTACRGKCKGGEVMMDETEGLSDSELRDGYVLTCVGHPLTNGVVIEIG